MEATGALGASAQKFLTLCARLASNRSAARAPFVDQTETHARKLELFRARISVALQRSMAQQVKAYMTNCVPATAAARVVEPLRRALFATRTSARADTLAHQ